MIAVGCYPNSNDTHFYNPVNGTFVSSITYKWHSTSGAHFGYHYQSGTFIYCLDESTTILTP